MMECPDLYGDCNRGGSGCLKESDTIPVNKCSSRGRSLHERRKQKAISAAGAAATRRTRARVARSSRQPARFAHRTRAVHGAERAAEGFHGHSEESGGHWLQRSGTVLLAAETGFGNSTDDGRYRARLPRCPL